MSQDCPDCGNAKSPQAERCQACYHSRLKGVIPPRGRCADCGRVVVLRTDGLTRAHARCRGGSYNSGGSAVVSPSQER